jgi:hypothetical protein
MKRYLTHIGIAFHRLVVSHAVAVGSREVKVAFKFVSERTVYRYMNCRNVTGCSLANLSRVQRAQFFGPSQNRKSPMNKAREDVKCSMP